MKRLYLLIFMASFACGPAPEEDHAHDADGNHIGEDMGVPGISETLWTSQTELFVEFPALVVGQTSRFAAHFTRLDGHQPVMEGAVTVSLLKGNKGIRHKVDAPNSPGIFIPALQPKEAGTYQLVFDLETPSYRDRIVIEDVTVYADLADAAKNVPQVGESEGISFLKEQAWKIDFQTAPVEEGEVYDVIHTSGVWEEAPNTYKTLVATSAGVVLLGGLKLTEGMSLKRGQLVATISSDGMTAKNVATELANAKSIFDKTRMEYERKSKLLASRIISKAEMEEVAQRFEVAKSNFDALNQGFSGGGKQITVPFDGFVKSVNVSNGSYVQEGEALMTIASHQSKLLVAHVSPSYSSQLNTIQNVWYQPSPTRWSSILEAGGEVLSVGKGVSADHPLLPVYASITEEVDQPDGGYTQVQVGVGEARKRLVVPDRALLEDYGAYSVMVQVSGETFERRNVTPGRRNGHWVEINAGLNPGEMIVTEGAFQVKMTSMAGQTPSHGHAH